MIEFTTTTHYPADAPKPAELNVMALQGWSFAGCAVAPPRVADQPGYTPLMAVIWQRTVPKSNRADYLTGPEACAADVAFGRREVPSLSEVIGTDYSVDPPQPLTRGALESMGAPGEFANVKKMDIGSPNHPAAQVRGKRTPAPAWLWYFAAGQGLFILLLLFMKAI